MSVKIFFSVIILLFITNQSTFSQTQQSNSQLEIIFQIPDTLVSTGVESGYLNIYLDNFNYEIFGFQFVIKSSRPDLVSFDFSNLGYETNGTLVDGFEYIEAIDRASDQSEYWFRCIADIFTVIGKKDGILPQQGGIAIKVPYRTTNAPDTTLSLTSLLTIEIPTDFSDPFANSIGVIADTIVDTFYLTCSMWINDSCVSWTEVTDTSEGFDVVYYDSSVVGLLDPAIVQVLEGSITLDILNCDLSGNGEIDISDLICLVNYMFKPTEPYLCPLLYCETGSDNQIDIGDLVYLITYMFKSGPPPPDL